MHMSGWLRCAFVKVCIRDNRPFFTDREYGVVSDYIHAFQTTGATVAVKPEQKEMYLTVS